MNWSLPYTLGVLASWKMAPPYARPYLAMTIASRRGGHIAKTRHAVTTAKYQALAERARRHMRRSRSCGPASGQNGDSAGRRRSSSAPDMPSIDAVKNVGVLQNRLATRAADMLRDHQCPGARKVYRHEVATILLRQVLRGTPLFGGSRRRPPQKSPSPSRPPIGSMRRRLNSTLPVRSAPRPMHPCGQANSRLARDQSPK